MATKRISGDYDKDHLKDDLQAEADARGLEVKGTGANGAVTKEDLVKALNDNDGEVSGAAGTAKVGPGGTPPAAGATTLEKTAPKNIPRAPQAQSLGGAEPTPPMDKFTEGTFVRKSDGEEYALAVVPMNPLNGRTHRAMNTAHYWEGTEEQFVKAFTKKGGEGLKVGDYPPKEGPKDE